MKRCMKKRLSKAFCVSYAALFGVCSLLGQTPMTAKAATDPGIVIDGDVKDWDHIKKIETNNEAMPYVAAFTTDTDLYIMREVSDPATWAVDQFYIDADGVHDNGLNLNGIDYLLEGGSLYEYAGIGGAWNWGVTHAFSVKMSDEKDVAEYKIPLSSLGNPSGKILINIHSFTANYAASYASYPSNTSELFEVAAFDDVYVESTDEEISNFDFKTNGELKAITEATMEGGTVGTFSAAGGNGNYSYGFAASSAYGKDNSKFKISGDKLSVKSGMLAPGKYSIYVKVTSGSRSEKKAFSIKVESADATTTIDEAIFSGKKGQWFSVDHNSVNLVANLLELKSACDSSYFYAFVDALSLGENAEFYISTTRDNGADMTDVWTDAASVTYKVTLDGKLYIYDGEFVENGTAEVYKTDKGAEIKVALKDLGDANGYIRVGIKDGNGGILPNQGKAMLTCVTPLVGELPTITLDGDDSDWAGISKIGTGSGSMDDLYAFKDDTNLYVCTSTNKFNFENNFAVSTNLLINVDGDASTGYQQDAYENSGADFLVQDWYSNGPERNIEFFWTEQKGWSWTLIKGHNAYKEYKQIGDVVVLEYVLPLADMEGYGIDITDDLKISVDRTPALLQGGTPEGRTPASGSYVSVQRKGSDVNVSLGDNSFADWESVGNVAKNFVAEAALNFYATRSADRLYTLVSSDAGGLNTVNTYYISTGKDTGFEFAGYENINYIVRDAKLFEVTADNTLSEALGDVWMSYYNDSVEMQLYLSQIGNPDTIEVGWRGVDGSYAIPSEGLLGVTATCNINREEGYYYPTEDFASFSNPYKGWVGWAREYEKDRDGQIAFDQSATYIAVRWSEFEPEKGKYDYEGISKKYGFDYWKQKGVRLNVRFVMDNPEVLEDGQTQRMDIPQWLYDELVAETEKGNIDNPGTFYNDMANLGGAGFSPNYNSELLLEYHDGVIKKLAEYFDDNSLTAFVQIGSLGHWAEFHTWPEGSGVFPNPEMATKYMESYTKYFKNVKVGLRKPYPYAAKNNFGLFNDIFGVSQYSGTYTYLDWINNGDTDIPYATNEDVANSKMPDFWKYNYSGGEFAEGDPKLHVDNAGIIGCLEQVRDTHVSWLGPCSPAGLSTDLLFSSLYEANILALQKQMGYNFALEKIANVGNVTTGENANLTMVWNNEGVAPFYYEWPLEFSLIDGSGKVVDKQVVNGGITSWLPGRTKVEVPVKFSNKVASGSYTLAVAILNKDTLEPGIRLAIAGGRDDLRYPLYTVNVTNSGKTDDSSSEVTNPVEQTTPAQEGIAVGETATSESGETVKALDGGEAVAVTKAVNKKNATIKATVKVNGKEYLVTGISSKATGSKVKKITIDGKNLKTVSAKAFMNSKKLTKIVVKHVKKNSKLGKQIIKAANKLSKKTGKKVKVTFKSQPK